MTQRPFSMLYTNRLRRIGRFLLQALLVALLILLGARLNVIKAQAACLTPDSALHHVATKEGLLVK
ncbi:hypothetical protein [Flaviaesturariibacter aridisoli]|uniref:Uncharacterized protein n=1 Tax=Flaviaesturariibacter aridisoli TaxID=2545761 RepID=A0A4R4E435_9BACT|nr:hypothetical protein [Flaviaesturariibacter aridisoli]TCZ73450.1 hypothetical protein E0486_05680 [Flaviaesturariibacter aridisoli]